MRTFVGEVFYALLLLFIDRGLYITHTALISQIAGYCQVRISKTPKSLRRIWDRKRKKNILPLQQKDTQIVAHLILVPWDTSLQNQVNVGKYTHGGLRLPRDTMNPPRLLNHSPTVLTHRLGFKSLLRYPWYLVTGFNPHKSRL